jgi:hypothetical protein
MASKRQTTGLIADVRYRELSGHTLRFTACPLSAKSGHWLTTRFRFSSRASGDTATASDRMPRSVPDHRRRSARVEIGGKSVWIDRTKGSVPAIITRPYFPC